MAVLKKSLLSKYIKIIKLLESFSRHEKLKVACLIIKNNNIISTGYNDILPKPLKYMTGRKNLGISTVHAEHNALMNCCINGIQTEGSIMIVSYFPCYICTKLAMLAGISKIYYVDDYNNEINPLIKKIPIEQIR